MINKDTDILLEVIKTYLTVDKYELSAFISLYQEQDAERHFKTVEDMMLQSIANKKTRGLLRCSQGEYVSIKNIHSVSFTWSLELAADVKNETVQGDIYNLINSTKETLLQIENGGISYDVILTSSQPVAFNNKTINGIDYMQVVTGGKCSVTDKSVLANSTSIKIDGTAISGLISYATGYSLSGENYTNTDDYKQRIEPLAYNNTLSVQIHCIKDNAIAKAFRRITANGALNLASNALKQYAIEINFNDGESPITQNYTLNQAQSVSSLGSFVLLDLQFITI